MSSLPEQEWMDSTALTDDMIRSSWSPASKEAQRSRRQAVDASPSKSALDSGLQQLDTQSETGSAGQGQQESKKSRFSLNFLRASLLSPKGGVSAKSSTGSIFSTSDRKAQTQTAAVGDPSSISPSKRDLFGESAASAQHWSPLGHGASAFSGSQADYEDTTDDVTSAAIEPNTDSQTGQQGARSPLRALSSNSPTRLRSAHSGSLNEAISIKGRPSLPHAADRPSRAAQRYPLDDDQFAPTMVLEPSAAMQHSPLPANALVAYSSDDDDWQNAVDATERIDISRTKRPAFLADNQDAASIASEHSDASTAEAAGSVYDLEQHSPAALFMSPSVSLGEHDNSGSYEPTMSPGAFQAAMAAGLLAVQQPTAAHAQQSKPASVGSLPGKASSALAAAPAAELDAKSTRTAADGPVAVGTPSSVASNSAMSLPAGNTRHAPMSSTAQMSQAGSVSATPVSKPTFAADSGVSAQISGADAASERLPGTPGSDTGSSVSQPHNRHTATHQTASQTAGPKSEGRHLEQQPQAVLSNAATQSDAASAVPVTLHAADNMQASTQLAEIAEEADQAHSSAPGSELTSVAGPAAAEESTAGQSAANGFSENTGISAAHAGRPLFSAVTKRPAETRLEGEPTSKTPRVPPAQSPGISVIQTEADPASPKATNATSFPLQLDSFVNTFVEDIVSEVRSELVAEAEAAAPSGISASSSNSAGPTLGGGVPFTEGSMPFTEGSKSAASPPVHRGRSSSARTTPVKAATSTSKLSKQAPAADDAVQTAISNAADSSGMGTQVLATSPPAQAQADQQESQADGVCAEPSEKQSQGVPQELAATADQKPGTASAEAPADASEASTSVEGAAQGRSKTQQSSSSELVHDLVHELVDAVIEHVAATQMQATASRTLSQAFSGGLPSPACAISISAAPAAVSQMDLAAAAGSITQSAASEGSAVTVPPAIAAQHAHLGSDADSHPVPSPNYRLDHVLADSLHSGMHASHDFGPMSLVSAMSNDENLTPAASSDFSRAARRVADRQPDVADATDQAEQATTAPVNARARQTVHHSTPPRVPLWETQMTPHGHRPASRIGPDATEDSAALPIVGPSTEVNALGQPLQAQQAAAAELVSNAAQRLAAAQATPAAVGRASVQPELAERDTSGSVGASSDADLVTPPGGFQAGQVWLNNVFSPEMPPERPRSAAAIETLRRLSSSPTLGHSQSAAPGLRHGPSRSVSLRIQVPNDPSRPDHSQAGSAASPSGTTASSQHHQQSSIATTVPVPVGLGSSSDAHTTVCPTVQVNVVGTSSPEFDAAFANEAEAMFALGQAGSTQASSIDQLQRRLRLSDVGLQPSPAPHTLLEDTKVIQELKAEVAQLQAANAELLRDKQEALPLLEAYRLSISQLQDKCSLNSVQAKTAVAVFESQNAKLQAERDNVQSQFKQLYHDKYQPLKAGQQAAQQQQEQQHQALEKLRTQLATADLKVRKAGLDIQDLTQQLQKSQEDLQTQGQAIADRDTALEAARAAEQQLRKQLTSASSSSTAMREAHAETESLRQQLEETVRKHSTAKQARERAMSEVYAKEEELCELQVKLAERDTSLKAYKTENSRFADMKDKFKADIAALQQEVSEKEAEKGTLLTMCNELMSKLEKEGISL